MIEVRTMNTEEYRHYSLFSFEHFISELALSSGQDPETIRSKHGAMPESPSANDLWLVISRRDQNIGFLWVQIRPELREAFGFDLYLDEAFRSKGIGREVMLQCSERIKTRGVDKVKICVFQENTVARKLYSSLGFVETEYNAERKQYSLEKTL